MSKGAQVFNVKPKILLSCCLLAIVCTDMNVTSLSLCMYRHECDKSFLLYVQTWMWQVFPFVCTDPIVTSLSFCKYRHDCDKSFLLKHTFKCMYDTMYNVSCASKAINRIFRKIYEMIAPMWLN